MIVPHEGNASLDHTFQEACDWLAHYGPTDLATIKRGTRFRAFVATTERGEHSGEPVIRFMQRGQEFGRAYSCCWGRYYNCNRTRIGMYCEALDTAMALGDAVR